jgi:DNA-binding HxlR family transcriptional regulator
VADFNQPGDVFLADCPARLAVDIVANKWSVVVISALSKGPRRHGDLKALIGGISSKMLTQTLRRLQRHGLISRHTYPEAPPRVEYDLTDLGQTLLEPVEMLSRWAETHGDAVLTAHDRHERAAVGHQSAG